MKWKRAILIKLIAEKNKLFHCWPRSIEYKLFQWLNLGSSFGGVRVIGDEISTFSTKLSKKTYFKKLVKKFIYNMIWNKQNCYVHYLLDHHGKSFFTIRIEHQASIVHTVLFIKQKTYNYVYESYTHHINNFHVI
jgi:hypothetical protein